MNKRVLSGAEQAERQLGGARPSPTPPGCQTWLMRDRCCELMGLSKRRLNEVAVSEKWPWRESKIIEANGKPQREYLLSSMRPEAQLKHAREAMVSPAKTDSLAVGSPTASSAPEPQTLALFPQEPEPRASTRVALPPHLYEQAKQRFEAIEPMLDWKKGSVIRLAGGRTISNRNELAVYIAAQQQPAVSVRTVWRWYMAFEKDGFDALADRVRSDKNKPRVLGDPMDPRRPAAWFLQKKYLHERLSARHAHEALLREWANIESHGEAPSYPTVRAYLNKIPLPGKILAHKGAEIFHAKCSPYILRTKQRVMDWWIADHRTHDVMVRNALFDHLKDDEAYRVSLTLIVDWGSRKFLGWCFAPTPSSRTIYSALRMSLSQFGFPKNFYWDNGKDYQKVKKHLEEILIAPNAQAALKKQKIGYGAYGPGITSALPFQPRSKPIESYFKRVSQRFDPIWKPAYLGNKPGNCPADCRDAQKQHDEYLRGKRSESPLPTDAEFILGATQWIDEFNRTPLESMDGRSPNEIFDEQYPVEERRPVPARSLDFLLSDPISRTVDQGGCVSIQRVRYAPSDLYLGPMSNRQGEKIMIIVDPYNLAEAVAFDPDTREFVAELAPQQFVNQNPSCPITQDMIRTEMRKQRALKRAYADWLGMIAAVAMASGYKSERHALLERAGLRTGTDDATGMTRAATPGARRPLQLPSPVLTRQGQRSDLAPAFVSDAIQPGDAELFSSVEVDD